MIDVKAIAAEIDAALADEVGRKPGEVTVYEYATARGLSVQQARRRLETGWVHKHLERRLATVNGHRMVLYRLHGVGGAS